jgi:hypothetical protein
MIIFKPALLVAAANLIAEIGVDMEQFGSAPQLASWDGHVPARFSRVFEVVVGHQK